MHCGLDVQKPVGKVQPWRKCGIRCRCREEAEGHSSTALGRVGDLGERRAGREGGEQRMRPGEQGSDRSQ